MASGTTIGAVGVRLAGAAAVLLCVNSAAAGDTARVKRFRVPADAYKLFVMNADGSGQRRLSGTAANDYDPAWSPDGTKIAFSAFSGRSYYRGQIFVVNPDGSGRKQLTNNPKDNFNPTWSPDGTKIAFTRGAYRHADIFVMNADGSGQVNLTNHPADDLFPAWSPDGTKIAFTTDRSTIYQIFSMNTDGSGQTNLTDDPALGPAWSPDSRRIAYAGLGRGGNADIFVMNADGSGQTKLTNSKADEFEPAWSPDGANIAFSGGTYLRYRLMVMSQNGGRTSSLTGNAESNLSPAWSRDGMKIAFVRQFVCHVPNVVGRTLRAARVALRAGNCAVGRIRRAPSPQPRGRVVRQKPRGGERLLGGGRVSLVLSRGPR